MVARTFAVQLAFHWGDTTERTVAFLTPRRVVIGGSSKADIVLPPEVVGEKFVLLDELEGRWVLYLPPGASLRTHGKTAGELRFDSNGDTCVELDPACRARLMLGPFAFDVRATDLQGHAFPAPRLGWRSMRWLAFAVLSYAFVVANILLTPPLASVNAMSSSENLRRYVDVTLGGMEPPPLPEIQQLPASGEAGGAPAPGEAGAVGMPEADPNRGGGLRIRGQAERTRVPLTREAVTKLATLTALRTVGEAISAISSPFGRADAQGADPEDAYGPLAALMTGIGPGSGGLAMTSTGRGGGCTSEVCLAQTVGQGNLDTVSFGQGRCTPERVAELERTRGHAAAVAECGRPGGRPPELTGDHVSKVPPPPPPPIVETTGGLSREDIRRIVRRNIAQVRFCYEQALPSRPDLEGRVAVQFVIRPDGAVLNSSLASSTLGNAQVESCIVQAVRRWPFPSSDGATVATYPFMLQPAH